MKEKVVVIIQARMGSTRLPGKVMKDLYGKTILAHDIHRVKQARLIDDIVIATTDLKEDDVIEAEALKYGVKIFRGSEEDVLSRYYGAATKFTAKIVVRITSDCPLIDPILLDEIIQFYLNHKFEIVSNASGDPKYRTYPRGLDIEIFSYQSLKRAFENADQKYQREHVTPYIYDNSIKVYYYKQEEDYSMYRWTLDTEEDWKVISKIYGFLYSGKHDFYMKEIIELMREQPDLYEINKNIEQKSVK